MWFSSSLYYYHVQREANCQYYCDFFKGKVSFLSVPFKISSGSLIFSHFDYDLLSMIFFEFLLLGFSKFLEYMVWVFHQLWKILYHHLFKIFSVPVYIFFFPFLNPILQMLKFLSMSHIILTFLFIFLHIFSLWTLHWVLSSFLTQSSSVSSLLWNAFTKFFI